VEGSALLPLAFAKELLDLLYASEQLRQPCFTCLNLHLFARRARNGPKNLAFGWHVLVESALGEGNGAIADVEVVGQTDLAGQDNAVADDTRATDSNLRTNDAVSADNAIVTDLDEVVYLCALPNDGPVEASTIHGAVRANLHVVLNLDNA
jgi:hypothetical protein